MGAIVTLAELVDHAKSAWARVKRAIRPRYRSAAEMSAAARTKTIPPVYGVTLQPTEPDGKDHHR